MTRALNYPTCTKPLDCFLVIPPRQLDLDHLAPEVAKEAPTIRAVRETIKAAREMKLWPVNGGITKENLTTAQKFLVETKFMKPENILPIDQLVTTKFRDQAIKDLGPA